MTRMRIVAGAGLLLAALSAFLPAAALGQGMIVPTDTSAPPLAIKSQQVEVAIDNQVATTTVKQVFVNSTSRALEANYVFPLPADSTIRDFAMMIGGKRVSGELVESGKAKEIYQRIVAQARDPGLLERLGDSLWRVNVFPIPANSTQTVELTYSQVIAGASGMFRYAYPLKTGEKASRVQDFFSVAVKLSSKVPIKSIYSPSGYQVGISKKGEHEATIGLELSKALLDRDFSLFWTVSEKDFGLNAAAYRPSADDDGYLLLLISPKSAVNQDAVLAKDVVFVFDTSGSMQGEKIEQCKKALKFCVDSLNEKDRFNVITFATDVTPYKDGLIEASKANKEAVRDFVNRLAAEGGTNIYEALATALALSAHRYSDTGDTDGTRPEIIVFLTDGCPTIGKTEPNDILSLLGAKNNERAIQELRERQTALHGGLSGRMQQPDMVNPESDEARHKIALKQEAAYKECEKEVAELDKQIAALTTAKGSTPRIFTFGVGDDVNTKLLDKVAQNSGGQPEYVRPSEDIEVKISDFFAKASHPVMTDLKLAFGGDIKVTQMFPTALPDLYFGQQVVAFARYAGSGSVAVTLTGNVSGGKAGVPEKNTYEVTLPKQTIDNNFIEPLWAHRKVGYLLDQVRLNGENKEIKDEIVRLSKKYKIQTPYTSFLVLEEQHRRQYLGPDVAGNDVSGSGSGSGGTGESSARGPAGQWRAGPPPEERDGAVGARSSGVAPAGRPEKSASGTPARPTPGPAAARTPTSPRVADAAEPTYSADRKKDLDKLQSIVNGELRVHDDAALPTADRLDGRRAASQPDSGWALRRPWTEDDLRADSGKAAVDIAKEIANLKRADAVGGAGDSSIAAGKTVAGRNFFVANGFWVDEKFDPACKLTFVKWGSEAYFAIVMGHEELKEVFALSTRLILVTAEGKALVVSPSEGEEKLDAGAIKDLFMAVVPVVHTK